MKHQSTLVIGGCRSGKSRHAMRMAQQVAGERKIYVGTCVPLDEEMRLRVQRHQDERGPGWRTVETPIEIGACIDDYSARADVILVDCLTLWISNLMGHGKDQETIVGEAKALGRCMKRVQCPVVLVSNEVGAGIVPENAMARQYRDTAGLVNQTLAGACDRVVWVVAGVPVSIK